jgi:hypothetical protein
MLASYDELVVGASLIPVEDGDFCWNVELCMFRAMSVGDSVCE